MNWKLKAHAMALLSRTPGGRMLYHRIQRWLGTNRLPPDEGIARAVEIVEMIRQAGAAPENALFLEIGTGWRPYLPFILHLAGARKIISLDVNPWLTWGYALETLRALAYRLHAIAGRIGVEPALVQARYERATRFTRDLPSLLEALGIDYRCPADARSTGLPDACVDHVVSSNVLEHISPDVLGQIHCESARVLRPGGLAVHRFNPGDHFASVDPSITAVNFLRYSPRQWRWYGGSGLSYHNRLRCPQHARLLADAGFDIALERVRIDQRAADAIRRQEVAIHPDFAQFAADELAADYMWLVGRRRAAALHATPAAADGVEQQLLSPPAEGSY